MGYIIAIDQGTTSTRSIVFDDQFAIVGQGQEEFAQHFPKSGWVEPVSYTHLTLPTKA